jgi:hypothetical protein
MDGYVDDLFRAAPSASGPTTAPTANNLNANAVRGEMNRLFTRSLRKAATFRLRIKLTLPKSSPREQASAKPTLKNELRK